MKNKSYSFTTEITPETEVLLSGRHGQPLTMRFTDFNYSRLTWRPEGNEPLPPASEDEYW